MDYFLTGGDQPQTYQLNWQLPLLVVNKRVFIKASLRLVVRTESTAHKTVS